MYDSQIGLSFGTSQERRSLAKNQPNIDATAGEVKREKNGETFTLSSTLF